jgi:two-component system response regulator DesR
MIRVLIAEEARMVRGALVALLSLETDIEVVAEVGTGDRIVELVRERKPDVAIIDIDLPVLDGLTAAARIRSSIPDVRALVLTNLGDPDTLRRALSVGVDGLILKDAPPAKLAAAIRDVAAGNRVVDSQLALTAWDGGEYPLTERELDVLRLAAAGTDIPDIAKALSLSVATVRDLLTNAVSKLDARNQVDAIRIASEAGWM